HREELRRGPDPVRTVPDGRDRTIPSRLTGFIKQRTARRSPAQVRADRDSRVPRVSVRSELHEKHDRAEARDASELLQVPDSSWACERQPALDDPHAEAGETPAEVP